MNLVRFDPFRELEQRTSRLNGLFSRPLAPLTDSAFESFAEWTPAIQLFGPSPQGWVTMTKR